MLNLHFSVRLGAVWAAVAVGACSSAPRHELPVFDGNTADLGPVDRDAERPFDGGDSATGDGTVSNDGSPSDAAYDGGRANVGEACTRAGDCVLTRDLRCIGQATAPESRVCCVPVGHACAPGECCGFSQCMNGTCQDQARGARCVSSIECATASGGTLLCENGYCGDQRSTCQAIFETCTSETECCNAAGTTTACRPSATPSTTSVCCIDAGNACPHNDGCCGYMACVSGVCARSPQGDPCVETRECANGLTCRGPAGSKFCQP